MLNKKGEIKICDFGISGRLINSQAKTKVGCQNYMAVRYHKIKKIKAQFKTIFCNHKKPERIDTNKINEFYTIKSDVWSFGITLYELAMGRFPYPITDKIFEQLENVVKHPAPIIEDERLSSEFRDFVKKW